LLPGADYEAQHVVQAERIFVQERRLRRSSCSGPEAWGVVDLVEWPKEVRLGSDLRVRGVACHEETSGWLQVKDKSGAVLAQLSLKVNKCMEAVAMTDVADFGKCTMVRRIDAGEALELLPDKAVQPSEGGSRSKFRACRDGQEGWITTKGSQGTEYIKAAQKHYVCKQATPVHAGLGAESAVVRVLMPGEAFAAFEEAKEVAGGEQQTQHRVKTADGKEGWIVTSSDQEVELWSSRCEIVKSVPLTSSLAANEAAESIQIIRLLEPNEVVDVIELPAIDGSTVCSGLVASPDRIVPLVGRLCVMALALSP